MEIQLTLESIQRAERGEGVTRTVIDLLDSFEPQIVQLNQEYFRLTNGEEQQKYIQENFGFLADALESTEDFTLKPLDLIGIWSKATKVCNGPESHSYYQRVGIAGMICSAYSTKGMQNQEKWKGFARYVLENLDLPERILDDREGLLYVKGRLDEVVESRSKIISFVNDTKYRTSLLDEVNENFGNGMGEVKGYVDIQLHYYK